MEVGSILEYSYQLRFNAQFYWHLDPYWQVQQKYFVHKAHFLFTPFDALDLVYWPNLPEGASIKTDAGGRYYLDITDDPPTPDEEWMPPIDSFLYKVRFYYRSQYDPVDPDEDWKAMAKEWSKDVDHFAEPTKTIRDAVAGLIATSDTDLAKAQKLYAAVEALDNTDYSRQVGTSWIKPWTWPAQMMPASRSPVCSATRPLAPETRDRTSSKTAPGCFRNGSRQQ